uniref:Oligopeptide transport system permease protein OppB (TC 3.A.1.5.1) n=1 Tax=uncultured Thiotrichaceae bacterium TaxID=298394 RepID=A0A6S6T7I7_9GAMM|nr:MAG: Oligopeptide transport system permease protein OppB (TC 3.A.1.5.1) [uncultured Thiotrichaceae bacterium]
MLAYIVRRLLLMIPTLWAIITINFFIVQLAPGGPVEQAMAQLQGMENSALDQISGANQGELSQSVGSDDQGSGYRGSQGLDPAIIKEIEQRFGFDKPMLERYWIMMKSYLFFDFGDSFFKGSTVGELVVDRLPVSISLGLWSTALIYLICIPLGVYKARHYASRFDSGSTTVLIVFSAIPGFLLAVMLVIIFAGGNYLDWFPLRGLTSNNWESLSWWGKIVDYLWHITLPTIALTVGSLVGLTLLTKNSFLDEIGKQYVMTARAKGNSERRVMYSHVFRNAMLIIIAGFPSSLIGILFTGSVLVEVIFSLEGLGLLGYEATLGRDYPVMFGTLYIFTFIGLLVNLLGDLMYTVVDPRIDFEARQ